MTRTDPEALSPDVERLIAEERNLAPAPAEVRARVVSRARAALRQTPMPPAGNFWRKRAALLVAAALLTAFTAAALAAWQNVRRAAGDRPNVAPPASGTHDTTARAPEPPIPAGEPAALRSESEARPGSSARPDNVASARRASGSDAYALELGLLQRARAAIASGKFSAALDATTEHQRRFPAGSLREEREALRIKALAGLGRNDEARLLAKQFRERFPQSVLSNRIEETVRQKP